MRDDRLIIPSSWPVTYASDDDLTSEQILDVIDQMGDHYQGALESLGDTVVPGQDDA